LEANRTRVVPTRTCVKPHKHYIVHFSSENVTIIVKPLSPSPVRPKSRPAGTRTNQKLCNTELLAATQRWRRRFRLCILTSANSSSNARNQRLS